MFFWAITLVPDMLEGQSRADDRLISKTCFGHKNDFLLWRPSPVKIRQIQKLVLFVTSPRANRTVKSNNYIFIETRRLAEFLEGLNSSVATEAGEANSPAYLLYRPVRSLNGRKSHFSLTFAQNQVNPWGLQRKIIYRLFHHCRIYFTSLFHPLLFLAFLANVINQPILVNTIIAY